MSEPKWTPGPWIPISSKVRFAGLGDGRPIFEDGLWHILPEYHIWRMPICTVDKGDDHDPPTRIKAEHDARLIACAPELYEALRQCAHQLQCLNVPNGPHNEALAAAHAALAKARGGE